MSNHENTNNNEQKNSFMQRLSTLEQKQDAILGLLRSLMHKVNNNFAKDADSNKDLYAALAKAQSEMKIANENNQNSYLGSKYADLTSVVKASRESLSKNGLATIHFTSYNEYGQTLLTARLSHSSGQYIDSVVAVNPKKDDIQSFGSQMTYLKRYTYASLVGVTSSLEDDDAEAAVAEKRELFAKGTALNQHYNPRDQSSQKITVEQLEEFERELAGHDDISEQVLEALKIDSFANLPKGSFKGTIDWVRDQKALRAGIKNKK